MRSGLVPGQMEDKWFIYWQDDTLYFHRSWTGFCVYVVRFEADGDSCRMAEADLNRERSQYDQTDDDHDAAMISYLIDVLLLDREADFPTDAADPGEAALQQWSEVGRAMLDEPREESIEEESFEDFKRAYENGDYELVTVGVATGELYEQILNAADPDDEDAGEGDTGEPPVGVGSGETPVAPTGGAEYRDVMTPAPPADLDRTRHDMPRYWVMAPVESQPSDRYDAVWQFDRDRSVISIGWSQLGDITGMTREELAASVAAAYPNKPPQTIGLYGNMLWAFYHELRPGDRIVARRGRMTLVGVGTISGPPRYAPDENPHVDHAGFIDVDWQDQPRDKTFPTIVFPMQTLTEFAKEEQFRSVVEESGAVVTTSGDETGVEDQGEFILEKYLEDFIVSNFAAIFKGRMEVFKDLEAGDGQQYEATGVGKIDILAIEPQSNAFVVIELKKGRSSDRVVGQVLRYMGWVKKNLCVDGQAVKGLIICRERDIKMDYALDMTNDIDVRYYSVSFSLAEKP